LSDSESSLFDSDDSSVIQEAISIQGSENGKSECSEDYSMIQFSTP
jgi:hypothetical protein